MPDMSPISDGGVEAVIHLDHPITNPVARAIKQVVIDYGLDQVGALHGWRCERPEIYGPCGHLDEFVTAMMEATRLQYVPDDNKPWSKYLIKNGEGRCRECHGLLRHLGNCSKVAADV